MFMLIFRPAFYAALFRDARNAVALALLGPTCRVTGERVDARHRVDHEHDEHPTDGPCVLL